MPPKTLHLTNAYHPSSGGVRTFYHALLRAADERDRALTLVVPGREAGEERIGRRGIIHVVRANPAPAFDRDYRVMLPTAYLPPATSAIGRILERERPDLVEICDKYSLSYLAALLRKGWLPHIPRPALVGLSCERMDDNVRAYVTEARLAARLSRAYIRHIYGPPFDCHLANSSYTADELRRALWDRPEDFIRVCPMGVDTAGFGPEHRDERLRTEVLQRAGGSAASVLLLYIGRLSPEKNVGLLVEMMGRLVGSTSRWDRPARDFRLVLVGDGPERTRLAEAAAQAAPGRVLFTGSVRDAVLLRRYYASADVFLHPNPREPFGIAPLEAMASGVPVVLPQTGGVTSYATRDNAFLVRAEPSAFALAVRAVVLDPGRPTVRAARQTALAHDWSVIAPRWFETYDRLIEQRRVRRPLAS